MRTIDAIAQIMKREGLDYLSAFPTTEVIEAAAEAGIQPIICRQERVGVGVGDGYSRVTNGKPPGAFAMQWGPGAENAFAGVATAYADAVPMLLLPLGHPRSRDGLFPYFSSLKSFDSITKSIEQITQPSRTVDAMRRAFASLKRGRPGPVMVEIPADVATMEVDPAQVDRYQPVREARSAGNPADILSAAKALLDAQHPVILAGQGVLYGEASEALVELAELTQIPVMTTMAGKSAFPERHPLSLGSASGVMNQPVHHFTEQADAVFGVGTSFTRHYMTMPIPRDKMLIQLSNDSRDLDSYYPIHHPILGDAKLALEQFLDACRDLLSTRGGRIENETAAEIARIRTTWLGTWQATLTSPETPMTPYRVIHEFMNTVDPDDAIVTHDSGSPRDQMMPFYQAGGPRSYLGWGKSHGLGTGLGLAIGAKLAAPEKLAVNFMGDAAFGMTGLDFETAARSNLPILTVVLNNATMAIETDHMARSHELFNTRDLGGRYADMAAAMGGWSERVEDPNDISAAFLRAKRATEDGKAALLEFITSEEQAFSRPPFK